MAAEKIRFGAFIAPFHPLNENPTLALERDLDLVVHMDKLGYDEAWLGEHDRAYRLGSMSIKMERKVQIFGRPAWNVEHNYL